MEVFWQGSDIQTPETRWKAGGNDCKSGASYISTGLELKANIRHTSIARDSVFSLQMSVWVQESGDKRCRVVKRGRGKLFTIMVKGWWRESVVSAWQDDLSHKISFDIVAQHHIIAGRIGGNPNWSKENGSTNVLVVFSRCRHQRGKDRRVTLP